MILSGVQLKVLSKKNVDFTQTGEISTESTKNIV